MSKSLGTLTLDLVAKTGNFIGPLDKANRSVKSNSKSMSSSLKAVGIAGIAAASGMAYMVKQSINTAADSRKTAQSLGITTEALTGLQWAANQATVGGSEVLEKGLIRLNASMGDALRGTELQQQAFENLGISLKDSEGNVKSADQVLMEIADRFSETEDGVAKTDAAVKLFGRSGAELIPLLNSGSAGIKELTDQAEALGLVISDRQAQLSENFNDSLATLGAVGKGTANQIAGELLPTLNDLTGLLIDFAQDSGTAQLAAEYLGGALKIVASAAIGVVNTLSMAASLVKALQSSSIKDLNDVDYDELTGDFTVSADKQNSNKAVWDTFLAEIEATNKKTAERLNNLWSGAYQDVGKNAAAIKKAMSVSGDESLVDEQSVKNAEEIVKQLEELKFQAENIGKTADEITVLKMALKGATETQQQEAAAALSTVAAYEEQKKAAEDLKDKQDEINKEATSIRESLLSEEESIKESYERRRQIILDNTEITGEAQAELLKKLEEKKNEDLADINDNYWEEYLEKLEENTEDLDEITGGMLDNLSKRSGDLFESAIFDSEDLGDAFQNTAEAMGRSMANAIGQMTTQWLTYQAVKLLSDKTTQGSAATTATANAEAMSLQAGINAYASAAAIPYTGWALAPGAMAAATAATTPAVAAIAALMSSAIGTAHDGIDSVPETGTWLLKKGERVTTSETSAKLDNTLEQVRQSQKADTSRSQPAQNIRIVNAFDSAVVGDYLGSAAGEKAVLNVVKRNKSTIKQLSS